MPDGEGGLPTNDNNRREDVLNQITHLTSQSYELAKSIDHGMLVHLLGMALIEIGQETAAGTSD